MKKLLLILFLFVTNFLYSQNNAVELDRLYPSIPVSRNFPASFEIRMEKGQVYRVKVQQLGVDVKVAVKRDGAVLFEQDSPNGNTGLEDFNYTAASSSKFQLLIERLEEQGNPDSGKVSLIIKNYSKTELANLEKLRRELETENRKDVLSLDIDHFWQAYDELKKAKSRGDSINTIQTLYLDRATDGLRDFINASQFTAEKFVNALGRFPKFYASVRANTMKVKQAEPDVQETINNFKKLYANFTSAKVCFAIGLVNTGGTVSSKFVLIGTEVTTSTRDIDLSEFGNSAFSKALAGDTNIIQKVKDVVAHESVHIQQTTKLDPESISCPLLYSCMSEGFCDFIGELTSGGQINKRLLEYGDTHENELWKQFKSQLCGNFQGEWLYNYSTVKDKPADLGYYIGYKIAQAYYNKAADKRQAIIDIIELKNPLKFLEKSGYDKASKK